jgi:uncharacterized protein YbbC (DUF1343 family)
MTLGELAHLFNAERGINARLTVVPMEGWRRADWFDGAGARWISPSPNLRSLTAATLYGGVGLLEKTNVSVGRGTETPFEVLGAPWIEAARLSEYLNRRRIRGVSFSAASFRPVSSRYAGELCHGVRVRLTNREALDVAQLGLELAAVLDRLYPSEFQLDAMRDLLSDDRLLRALKSGADPRGLAAEWQDELRRFEQVRARYLLY